VVANKNYIVKQTEVTNRLMTMKSMMMMMMMISLEYTN